MDPASARRGAATRATHGFAQVCVAMLQLRVLETARMQQRISLITLGVEDLARARAFYEALGWAGAHQPDDEVAFFQAGGMVFGLWTALGGHGAPGVELAHNVGSPAEVDEVLAEAARAGASIVRPARLMEWGGYSGAFADPDGYVWEVAHNPGWTLQDDGSVRL
jgi:predicted lactoylglutathione lyase